MAEDGGPPLKRTKLKDEYDKLSREELIQRLHDQDAYIETLVSKQRDADTAGDESGVSKEAEDKLKLQQVEATRRENVLVMRLTTKEQEMQEYLNQIQELKQVKNSATSQLRGMLLDPAINLMFQRMKREMDSCKEKLEQAQNDLAAWKFTPDSQTGKRLMAKCRMLLQENEELGKVISAGRTAKLEGEIALQKKFVEEMKKSQAETDEFLVEMDEDMEGMQSTIYFLQQQLKDAKDNISLLQQEKADLEKRYNQATVHQSQPAFPDSAADAMPNNQMDVDDGAEMEGCEEKVRTTGLTTTGGHLNNPHHTGNNISNRTTESHGSDAVTSSDAQRTNNLADHKHPQVHVQKDDSKISASTENGEHVAMETDLSEEPQSSCDDDGQQLDRRPGNSHENPEAKSNPRPSSPISPPQNHVPPRTSQSSDTYEGTDASSDVWSPSNQSKTSGMVSDDDRGTRGDKYRTDNKSCADRLHNGLIAPQYESPEKEVAK